jgi:hypothetical protein
MLIHEHRHEFSCMPEEDDEHVAGLHPALKNLKGSDDGV